MPKNAPVLKLTQERLKSIYIYDSETGIFTNRINICGSGFADDISGSFRPDGYGTICINRKKYLVHRLAWLYVNGYMPENNIDHIDRDPTNNKISNLREVSQGCNMRNRKKLKNNSSGVSGVSWNKSRDIWVSTIRAGGKHRHLGYFKIFKDAVTARWKAEVEYGFPNCNTVSSAYKYLQNNKIED